MQFYKNNKGLYIMCKLKQTECTIFPPFPSFGLWCKGVHGNSARLSLPFLCLHFRENIIRFTTQFSLHFLCLILFPSTWDQYYQTEADLLVYISIGV